MTNNYYQKKQKKAFKKGLSKVPKSFRRKKDKKHQYHHDRYRNLSEEENEKKQKYSHERYKNLLEDEYRNFFF